MRKLPVAVVALLLLATAAFAQQDFSKVQIKVTKVAGTVYMLTGAGGNMAVSVGDDGIVLVDDQFAPLAPKIEAALKSITNKPLRFVLNTHWHGDHTGGNEHFGSEAPIIAHDNVRKRLIEGGVVLGTTYPPAAKTALPVITFNTDAVVHLNGEDIRALHVPNSHTDGDSIIFFTQSKVVHMGDDFNTAGFPFIDAGSGGTYKGYVAAVDKVLAQLSPDVKLIPGHGALSTVADLRDFATMLRQTHDAVEKEVRAGKTLEQLKKEKVLEPWNKWGPNNATADRFIDALYSDITGTQVGHWEPHGHIEYSRAGAAN